jgi:hypothetical protein
MPNLGVNVPYLSLGVQKFFKPEEKENPRPELERPDLLFGLTGIFSGKEMNPKGVGRFPVFAASLFARKYFGPKAGMEASLDIIYKTSLLSHPSYPQAAGLDPLQIGLFVGYVHPFDRLHFLYGAGVYLRDVSQFIGVITMSMMFLSPIFYPANALPEAYRHWLYLNPLTPAIEQTRNVLYWGSPPDFELLGLYWLGTAVICWLGFAWFQKTRKGFADVL